MVDIPVHAVRSLCVVASTSGLQPFASLLQQCEPMRVGHSPRSLLLNASTGRCPLAQPRMAWVESSNPRMAKHSSGRASAKCQMSCGSNALCSCLIERRPSRRSLQWPNSLSNTEPPDMQSVFQHVGRSSPPRRCSQAVIKFQKHIPYKKPNRRS